MRRIAGVLIAAIMLAIAGCDSGEKPNTGPELKRNPTGPGPMKTPGEGAPSVPPTMK